MAYFSVSLILIVRNGEVGQVLKWVHDNLMHLKAKNPEMYESSGNHAQVLVQTIDEQKNNPFETAIYGAGSDLIKTELSAYGEKLLGSSSAYVCSNFDRYFSDPYYYFQVNEGYVKNKVKMILFPFLHKGHWIRTIEKVGGEYSYKPPIYDINAPDLYIPLMAFLTYLVVAGFYLGINGKFIPEGLGVQFTNGLLCWLFQILLLEATLHTLGDRDIPLLDVVSYAGYIFVAVSMILTARILCQYLFYAVTLWESFCMGMFLVKILKRVLISEVRISEKHSTKRHYVLLLVAIAQLPLLFWIGNVGD